MFKYRDVAIKTDSLGQYNGRWQGLILYFRFPSWSRTGAYYGVATNEFQIGAESIAGFKTVHETAKYAVAMIKHIITSWEATSIQTNKLTRWYGVASMNANLYKSSYLADASGWDDSWMLCAKLPFGDTNEPIKAKEA